MSRAPLKIENFSSDELKAFLSKDEKFQQGVRLYACYQVSLGKKPKELEDLYQTSFKSICNWVHRLNKGGIEALTDKVKSGRPAKISTEQKAEIRKIVLTSSPEEYGYNSSTWTGILLIDFIKKNYQVSYKKAQIYNILKKMGLTFSKSKGIYPEINERETKVEEIKKNSRGAKKRE